MPRLPRLPVALRRARSPLRRVPIRFLLGLAVGLVLVGGGWIVLRDSALVRIERVEVIGLSSSEGPQVRRALEQAARQMTTLHVRHEDLDGAVERFASVAAVRTQTDFPHALTIEVTEREPLAEVRFAGERVPVGAGGRLMREVEPQRSLPQLHATRLAPGDRLTDRKALDAIAALAAAPEVLRRRVSRVWTGPKGLTLDVRSGPQLFFGAAARLEAKWMATARVLAEPSAAGAVYLDVRVPDRVAAGGLGTLPEPSGVGVAGEAQAPAADPQLQPEETPSLDP